MKSEHVEIWRRQRSYVTAELRKDIPDSLAHLSLATGLMLVVGVAEGVTLSTRPGDFRFPLRYALYNLLPGCVGGSVPATNVASAMVNGPPVRTCPRAVAHACNLRALRTLVAGCTVIRIALQMTIAGGRGTDAYERAVMEGREMPSLVDRHSLASGVVRLCGIRGLESALAAARRRNNEGVQASAIFPIVIGGGAPRAEARFTSWLPEGALAAVAARSPHPAFFRVSPDQLFSREAWAPATHEFATTATLKRGKEVLIVEADTLSSEVPQALLSSYANSRAERMGIERVRRKETDGQLDRDQAVWGLSVLRRALEEAERGSDGCAEVASVILADTRFAAVEEELTVIIDARAALLASVLAWAQKLSEDATADTDDPGSVDVVDDSGEEGEVVEQLLEATLGRVVTDGTSSTPSTKSTIAETETPGSANLRNETASEACIADNGENDAVIDSNNAGGDDYDLVPAPTRMLQVLERTGSRVRAIVSPGRHLGRTIAKPISVILTWLSWLASSGNGEEKADESDTRRDRTLVYDTDDNDSFQWLSAQMLRQGWTIRRTGEGPDPQERPRSILQAGHIIEQTVTSTRACGINNDTSMDAPLLVHHCSDEKTMTATARHLARRDQGRPICAVVHRWDCGAQARELLAAPRASTVSPTCPSSAGRRSSVEVICTEEVGEDLLEIVRNKLRSGAGTSEVQGLLDDLFGSFYETKR